MKFAGKRLIVSASAVAMGLGLSFSGNLSAGDGLFAKGASKASQTGNTANHKHDHGQVSQTVAQVGDVTAEGTVISVTPVYAPGEEPGKASFDGTRQDAHAAPHGYAPAAGHLANVTSEPTPIGVVQTNYNNRPGATSPVGMPRDVMAHGRQAGAPAPGMMPPGMVPPGQTPNLGVKTPRRGLMGLLKPRKSAANDPYAVFHMSKSQRSMHAAMPVGPQGQPNVNSLPPSAVYGH